MGAAGSTCSRLDWKGAVRRVPVRPGGRAPHPGAAGPRTPHGRRRAAARREPGRRLLLRGRRGPGASAARSRRPADPGPVGARPASTAPRSWRTGGGGASRPTGRCGRTTARCRTTPSSPHPARPTGSGHDMARLHMGYLAEAAWAETDYVPEVWEYLAMRQFNNFRPCPTITDAVGGYELPAALTPSPTCSGSSRWPGTPPPSSTTCTRTPRNCERPGASEPARGDRRNERAG